jgi:RNA polymerase sigma-70 factor, ECF subfamily
MVVPWPEQNRVPDAELTAASPECDTGAAVDWAELVERIRAGDQDAMEELYSRFGKGIRYSFFRHLGPQDLDDKVHDTFLIVVQAIRKGELRDPDRLMGFVRTVVRRQVAAHIEDAVHARRDVTAVDPATPLLDQSSTAEEQMISQEQVSLMLRTLSSMPARDRELLTRFYLEDQSQEQICREMGLTDTQFRLFKSRAKARFGEKGRRRIERKPPQKLLVRIFSSFRTSK